MSRKIEYICDSCGGTFKTRREGGRIPTSRNLIAVHPRPIFTLTNNKGEVFDFCSRDCLEFGDFE